jgi:autonomous glycyl radical cofactor GrcA
MDSIAKNEARCGMEKLLEGGVTSSESSAWIARRQLRERVRIEFANTPIEVWPHSKVEVGQSLNRWGYYFRKKMNASDLLSLL